MSSDISYTEAYNELQTIISEMENSEITIDDLDSRIKRASDLLKICKDKLYKTETSVQQILEEIKNYTVE